MSTSSAHVDPEVLVSYVEGILSGRPRAEVEEHVEVCGTCRGELALAEDYVSQPVGAQMQRSEALRAAFTRRLDARLSSARGVGRRSRPPRRRMRWLGGGLLAASVAVLAVGIVQMQRPGGPDGLGQHLRSGPGQARLTAQVAPVGDGWELRWEGDAGFRDVALVVTSANGVVALRRELAGSRVEFGRDELEGVEPRDVLFVQVVGTDALGRQVRSRPERLP